MKTYLALFIIFSSVYAWATWNGTVYLNDEEVDNAYVFTNRPGEGYYYTQNGAYHLSEVNGMVDGHYYQWIKALKIILSNRYSGYNYVASTFYYSPSVWGLDIDIIIEPEE